MKCIMSRALGMALTGSMLISVVQLTSMSVASAQSVSSNAPVIFDVRRSLPLEPDEPVYHDFYINAGPESGLKKGMFVNVVRQVPVHDPIQNKQQAILNVPVGKLQVLHVDRGITVARLQSEVPDDERPVLEFEAVMIGDKIDLASATTDAPKTPKAKPKTASQAAQVKTAETREASAEAIATVEAAPADGAEKAATAAETARAAAALQVEESSPPSKKLDASMPAVAVPPKTAPPAPATVPARAKPAPIAPGAVPPGGTASVEKAPSTPFTGGENASPASSGADIVRVPIPTQSTSPKL